MVIRTQRENASTWNGTPSQLLALSVKLKHQTINPYQSTVELHSTALSALSGPLSKSNRHIFYTESHDDISLCSCYTVAEFGLGRFQSSWKINLGQTVGMHNNLHRKWLRRMAE